MVSARSTKPKVLVLYNQVGHDDYESLREVDPATLGFTPEYPIQVATVREEIDAVVKALKRQGYAARSINVHEDLHTLQSALHRKPDVVFNLVEFFHDTPGMESTVAALYELYQIPYTGAGPFGLTLCRRKGLTKQVLLANGVPTPHYRQLSRPAIPRRHGLHYPLIVKPAREDASAGVSKESVVSDYASLLEQVGKVFKEFRPPVLVEEYIEGREIHVSILGNDPPKVLPIIEFDFSELPPDYPRIISYDAKWNPLKEEYHRLHSICPAKLNSRLQRKIEEISVRAFQITGCRDYARLDLRLDARNRVSVLEVNPNPDLTEGVSFMESAEKGGMKFAETLGKIVEFARSRAPQPKTRPKEVRLNSRKPLLLSLSASLLLGLQSYGGYGQTKIIVQAKSQKGSMDSIVQTLSRDVFADIGERDIAERRGQLEEVLPPKLPRKMLPTGKSDPSAAFAPPPRLDTPEELSAELEQHRRLYAPFLADLAPELPSVRETVRLETFQWRLETDADRAEFQHTASGAGDWTAIKVPHFGGPIGRAVAYYRTTFPVTRAMLDKGAVFVRFGAVDYKAHVFLNGYYLGSHEGFFAPFAFECTASAREGENTLLVKVENDAVYLGNDSWGQPEEGDKLYAATNLGWDDPELGWHHCPPGFGIYQDVFVDACAPLHVADLWVRPLPDENRAEAWIEVWNQDRRNRSASVEISVFGQNFRETVVSGLRHTPGARIIPGVGDLQKPTDNQDVALTMGAGSNLIKVPLAIPHPRRWDLKTPWLYQIQVRLLDESGNVVDAAKRQFGMRTFRQETDKVPRGRMFLNGREIKLRGANTMGFEQQDVFRKDFNQLVDDILLAKICNMNYLRLTQRPVQPEVYAYCDRLGLMTQTDLPLFGCLRNNKFAEAIRQSEEMERLVRGHACNIMITYINEPFPNASGKPHRHLTRPDLQAFFEAADRAVRVMNPDRVVKHIEGDYDPPGETLPDNHCYCGWYNGHGLELGKLHRGYWVPVNRDWLYACGEFGAEGLDPADLMRRRYPPAWLPGVDESSWTPDAIPGAQTGKFHYMWFDTQHTLEDWVSASQRHQAWATRLFAERFRRDNRMVSFAIHLFIDAFPSSWMKTIMDCERRPKPAYFAYRDALEPLTVSIRTDRWAFTSGEQMTFEFWVCNDTHEAPKALRLHWQIEQDGRVIFARKGPAAAQPARATFQGFFAHDAPHVDQRTKYTLRLGLADGDKILLDTGIEYEVFPALSVLQNAQVNVIGGGKAQQLVRELGVKPETKAPLVILVDDYAAYQQRQHDVDRAVAAGARAVFLELPVGEYEIGGSTVRVSECVMRAREFVSRATGHRLVSGFEPEDFKRWYDPEAGYFRPILPTVFDAEGWQPILTNGNGIWGSGAWKQMLAAAEKPSGSGAYIVSQVTLAGRTRHNPTAAIFARRLLER